MFDIYQERIAMPLQQVKKTGFLPLLCGGIVNPMGPTLAVMALRPCRPGAKNNELLEITMNPFSQEVHRIGCTNGNPWGVDACEPLFQNCSLGNCPTLFTPSISLIGSHAVEIHASWIYRFTDAAAKWKMIQRHRGDPWTRISEEMNGSVPAKRSLLSRILPEKEFGRSEARQFATFALSKRHSDPELQAFMFAWKGSIDFQHSSGSIELAAAALPVEELTGWLDSIASNCHAFLQRQ